MKDPQRTTTTTTTRPTPILHSPSSPNTRYQVVFRVPPQFLDLCERDQVRMAQVLKNFVLDLCAVVPLTKQSRHVGRGEQAQKAARAYYEAAGYGKAGKDQ